MSATATDPAGNTSEFSADTIVTSSVVYVGQPQRRRLGHPQQLVDRRGSDGELTTW